MSSTSRTRDARVLERSEHPISRKALHGSAVKVLHRLHKANRAAFVVGGAVRDLLLDRKPKDYDVATEARPGEIKRLFRNSRIIGRRFRLVHVYFREGVVEVSTFRRGPGARDASTDAERLLITDDNLFGTPRQDAFRRDFSINALFFDAARDEVIDYVGGIEDLRAGVLRTIGDPDVRFQEDPVRMMRACEYAGRLDFTIEAATQEGVVNRCREIEKASPARLLEEIMQLLRSGSSAAALQWQLELGLLEHLMPSLHAAVTSGARGRPYHRLFAELDRIAAEGRRPADGALVAALLLPAVSREIDERERHGRNRLKTRARRAIMAEHAHHFAARFRISKVRAERAADTLLAVWQLREREWKMPERIRFAQRAVFEDALVLYELLCGVDGLDRKQLEAWRKLVQHPKDESRPKRPRRGRRRRSRRGRPRRAGR